MLWIISAGVFLFIVFVLYSCVVAGGRADRKMNELMKNIRKK